MLAVLLAATSAFSAPMANTLPSGAVILSTAAAPSLLRQCSRPSIEDPEGYWLPSAADILLLERRLPAHLAKQKAGVSLAGAMRQYAGVVAGGRKLIYANVFPEPSAEETARWREEAYLACDGGSRFWGIAFDVKAKTFSRFHANGES